MDAAPSAASPPRRARPLVTANQVTIARLLLLPVGGWLLYQGERGQWIALIFMTLVGCTDFVDGYLARKQGPTILGGLMDPIADKLFATATLLPVIALRWAPWWIMALIFLREFLVTSARTSFTRSDLSIRTSYASKVKTWYQMIIPGLFFLIRLSPHMTSLVMGVLAACALVGGAVFWLIKRRVWKGSVVFVISFGTLATGGLLLGSVNGFSLLLAWCTVGLTWLSGGGYFSGLPALLRKRSLDAHDLVRAAGAAMPILACALVGYGVGLDWAVITTVGAEFAIGGLDNLLATQGKLLSAGGWAARVAAQVVLLGGALYVGLRHVGPPVAAPVLCVAALAVTLGSCGVTFWRHRKAYLDEKALTPIAVAAVPDL